MKMYALTSLLGLATLVYGQDDSTVHRRRLAVEKCQFADTRAGAHDPHCMGKTTWTMKEATGDADPASFAVVHHNYRCCIDKHPGWTTAAKFQQTCTAVASCVDIKADDAACVAKNKKTSSFYTLGYSYSGACNNYADDCRASLSCNTAGGFSGTADLACQGATNGNGDFALKGCARGDSGTLGSDLTSSVFIVAPHTAPKSSGNAKNSFAECKSSAHHYGHTLAFVAGNGGCDMENTCNTADQCAVFPSWDKVLEPSESDDTYIKPTKFRSQLNEPCVTDGPNPTPSSTAKVCPNGASQDDTAVYGGFDLYGDRFSCWRNVGGGLATKKNTDMKALDLTIKVMNDPVNAGIGKSLFDYEASIGSSVFAFNGVWNGDNVNGNGYGVCDGVELGGCTAELAAVMCEAYNKKLLKDNPAKDDTTGFCTGFVLSDSSVGLGDPKKKTYRKTFPYQMLVGFFSKVGNDQKYDAGKNFLGGYFKYLEVANCLSTDTTDCSKCEKCKAGFLIDSDGQCVDKCKKYQYNNGNGRCDYCMPHCIECSADGQTCTKCHVGTHALSGDATSCDEIGCPVPAKLESAASDPLVGAIVGASPACSISQNLVPLAACGIECGPGTFSNDPALTHVYSCPSKGAVTAPTITCGKCTNVKCSSCPGDTCDTCLSGHVLSADKKTCAPKACPNGGTAGSCTVCPLGSAGVLTWDFDTEDWNTDACEACTIANCKDCAGDKDVCKTCDAAYALKSAAGKECLLLPYCPYGQTGTTSWDATNAKFVFTSCKADTATCEDPNDTKGACKDCKDGHAGSVDWDYANAKWITTQCHVIACPKASETGPDCKNCPAFTTGTPAWDDLFNSWEGCVANDFGFSGPSASWSGSVSADRHALDTKSAEMLHVANAQYDAIKEEWVCDEGFAGVNCQQRLCPETSAFVSGTDSFTPSQSVGSTWMTDIGTSTSATFSNQHSYRECSGRGSCDFETGICQCFPGFTGVGCRRTTCPNGCSGHGVCLNDDTSNYHAAGNNNLPSDDRDVNTWGNLWAESKFQGCRCDGGWGGHDCSLRQCPRGDDPETSCDEDLGNDVQILACGGLFTTKEAYFKLRFTDQLGHRYNTRAIVVTKTDASIDQATMDLYGEQFNNAAAHSIQTALESLPNFAVPKLEVTANPAVPAYVVTSTNIGTKKKPNFVDIPDFSKPFTATFELKFTDSRNSGVLPLIEVETDAKCLSGVQPKYVNTDVPVCTITRKAKPKKSIVVGAVTIETDVDFRENLECSNRGLCNRKTAECNCFDGYTGLACDTIAQTY